MYPRKINLLRTKSFFLFGARGTGKSHLLQRELAPQTLLWLDLLNDKEFLRYSRNPSLLFDQTIALIKKPSPKKRWIVIDEVQRVPKLLNEVHRILEDRECRGKVLFALTGSSARKLKKGGANLLGGRALVNNLFPLTSLELGDDFDLDLVLNWGSLPAIVTEKDTLTRSEMLESYFATYLREEIREEQIVRQLDPFNRFLEVAAQSSGQIVNYSSVARDCQVEPKSVARYYQILEDTLLGTFLPSYDRSLRQQQSKSPRFYIFDLGVQRALRGALTIPIAPSSYGYGALFEQFFILEVLRLNSYLRARYKLYYLRTKDDAEIDLIVERAGKKTLLLEIKSTSMVNVQHARHLCRFLPEFKHAEAWLVSQDSKRREEQGVVMLPWRQALAEMFEL